ncbi:MAG: ATP-binding protein [Candidatus Altiarchaeota archaeon]|nr:ATP-binding protein [Candidatus Altiarchaeota archaeon]
MSLIFGASPSLIKKFGTKKAMYLGRTETDNQDFFVDSIKPHVIFICGARGSGKSYTMGIIVEELAHKNDALASIVIDPIGVFWSMKHENKVEKELELLESWGLKSRGFDNIKVLVPIGAKKLPTKTFDGYLSIHPSELSATDWAFSFDLDRFSPAGLLIDNAIQKAGENYTIDDLVRVVSSDPDLQSKERGFSKQTRRGIISRLESAKYWGIFSDKATPLEKIAVPGSVSVIDVSFLEEPVAALIVGIIARKTLERRKLESRKEALGEPTTFPPVWLFIDEAHVMIPKDRKTAASDSIIEYVKQGRKPGCSIVLATQQPSAINSNVLSQLDLMFVHQLVFADDIKAVSKRIPAAMPKEWDVNFIRKLKTGQAVVGDRETTQTTLMTSRIRMSQHEGRSKLAVDKPQVVLQIDDPTPEEIGEMTPGEETPTKKTEVIEEKAGGRKIPSVKPIMELEDAEKLARKHLKKLLFIETEKFDVKMKIHWPFWVVRGVGLDGEVEFLFDGILGEIQGSKGLQRMLDLNPLSARIVSKGGTLDEISKRCEADPKMVKLQLNRLTNLGLIRVKGKKEKKYTPRLEFPEKLPEFDGAIRDVTPEGRIMKPVFIPDKKLFKILGVKPTEKTLIYMPYALFRTDSKKQIWVNLSTRKFEKRKLRLKI